MLDQQYLRPKTLAEAVELKNKYGKDAKILAGGTDLIINLKEGMVSCKYLIDIKKIPEMNEMTYSEETGLSIGGAVPLNDIIAFKNVQENYSVLKDGAKSLANSLLRNRATMVGNLCNASPAGDMLPVSIVLDGKVEAISTDGKREIPLKGFFLGVKRNALKDNEIALRIIFPPAEGKGCYLRRSRIKGHDLSQIGVAGLLKQDGELVLSIGSAAPVPVFINNLGSYKKEELRDKETVDLIISKILTLINPISDQRATREYRIAMAKYLTCKVLEELGKEA